jgi:hypothetical protein
VKELRFICLRGCTNCCRQRGFVYLSEADLGRAAAFLGLSPREFERRYIYRTKHLLRLRKPRGAQCPFLGEDGCGVHPAKPTQCRVFPLWPDLLEDRGEWREVAAYCPGIGRGPRVSSQRILCAARELRQAYPRLYGLV